MDPYARCVLHGIISKRSHMFYQLLVSKYPGFFEAIHAILDAHLDPNLVFGQCLEVISINDLLWDDLHGNAHELTVW